MQCIDRISKEQTMADPKKNYIADKINWRTNQIQKTNPNRTNKKNIYSFLSSETTARHLAAALAGASTPSCSRPEGISMPLHSSLQQTSQPKTL